MYGRSRDDLECLRGRRKGARVGGGIVRMLCFVVDEEDLQGEGRVRSASRLLEDWSAKDGEENAEEAVLISRLGKGVKTRAESRITCSHRRPRLPVRNASSEWSVHPVDVCESGWTACTRIDGYWEQEWGGMRGK